MKFPGPTRREITTSQSRDNFRCEVLGVSWLNEHFYLPIPMLMVGTTLWAPLPGYRVISSNNFKCTHSVKAFVNIPARWASEMRPQVEAANIETECRESACKDGFPVPSSERVLRV